MAPVYTALLSLLTISTLASAQTPSLNDALSAHANLSSLQGLLRDQLPDLFKSLQAHDAATDPIVPAGILDAWQINKYDE